MKNFLELYELQRDGFISKDYFITLLKENNLYEFYLEILEIQKEILKEEER